MVPLLSARFPFTSPISSRSVWACTDRHKTALLLAIVVAAAAWLRFNELLFQSYWLDEMATVYLSDPENNLQQVITSALNDNTTPLYQILVWSWFNLFGFGEYSGRSFSATVGTCSVVAMYYLAKEYINNHAAIIAAAITATNQFLVYYSQEARSYQLLFLLTALSLLFLSRFLRKREFREYFIYTLFCVCLVQTHYYGILVYLAQACLFLGYAYHPGSGYSVIRKWFWANAAITALSLLPAIPYLAENASRKTTWIEMPEPGFFINYFSEYFADGEFTVFFTILCVTGLFGLYKSTSKRQKNILYLALLSVLFIIVLPYLRSVLDTPMLRPKYTIGLLPVIILLSAKGLEFIKYKGVRVLVEVLLIIFSFYLLFVENNYYKTINKEQYREALVYIAANSENPVVYYHHKSLKPYARMLGYSFDIRKTSGTSLKDIRAHNEKFWLILRNDRLFEWDSMLGDNFEFVKAQNISLEKNIKKHRIRILKYAYIPMTGHTSETPSITNGVEKSLDYKFVNIRFAQIILPGNS